MIFARFFSLRIKSQPNFEREIYSQVVYVAVTLAIIKTLFTLDFSFSQSFLSQYV